LSVAQKAVHQPWSVEEQLEPDGERTPLLACIAQPVGPLETRALSDPYNDRPEVMDDPYRYFGW